MKKELKNSFKQFKYFIPNGTEEQFDIYTLNKINECIDNFFDSQNLNIIDFDDTLVFSSKALYNAYKMAIKEITILNFPYKLWKKHKGKSYTFFTDELGINREVAETINSYKQLFYPRFFSQIKLNKKLIDNIRIQDINIIVTYTTEENVKQILYQFKNELKNIDFIILDKSVINDRKVIYNIIKKIYSNIKYVNVYDDLKINLKYAEEVFKDKILTINLVKENE